MREEDVPAEQPEAEEEAWLPGAHALARRASAAAAAAGQGSAPPVGLIWRVRDRATFRLLTAAPRRRRGPIVIAVAAVTAGPPRVAYAVGRATGRAVVRNRVRRRLRAAVRQSAALLRPGYAYLVSARPGAAELTQSDINSAVRAILGDLHAEPAR